MNSNGHYELGEALNSEVGELKLQTGLKRSEIVSVQSLSRAVVDVFKVSKEELFGRRRHRYLTAPRHVLFFLAYRYTVYSLPKLGQMFGRDHTTILHGVDKIRKQKNENPELETLIQEVYLLALEYEVDREEKMERYRDEVAQMIEAIKDKRQKESGLYE